MISLRAAGMLMLIGTILASGCSLGSGDPIAGAPPGTAATKVGAASGSNKPASSASPPTEREIDFSLRHISVKYRNGFGYSDPMPLLTGAQVAAYAPIMAREFPGLKPGERLRFRFTDPHFGYPHVDVMETRPQDGSIEYWFSAIAVAEPAPEGMEDTFLGELTEGAPGQEIFNHQSSSYLKDPLSGAARDTAITVASERKMLQTAQDEQVVAPEEGPRLEALIARQRLSLQTWEAFWEKRRALKKALDLKLMDQTSYQTQVTRIYADLER